MKTLPVTIFILLLVMLQFAAILPISGVDIAPKRCSDWVVSTPTWFNNTTITLNGNLTITGTGVLTLHNVTLLVNCTSNGSNWIHVLSGGGFYIYDRDNNGTTKNDESNLTSPNLDKAFLLTVDDGAFFEVKSSIIRYGGYYNSSTLQTYPIEIKADNTVIENCTVEDCLFFYINGASGVHVKGSVFTTNKSVLIYYPGMGIKLDCCPYSIVDHNSFYNSYVDVTLSDHTSVEGNAIYDGHIALIQSNYSIISNNSLLNSLSSTSDKVFIGLVGWTGDIYPTHDNIIINNTVTGNGVNNLHGLYIESCVTSYNLYARNRISDNFAGIDCYGQKQVFEDNVIESCYGPLGGGLRFLCGSDNNLAENCTINNSSLGIYAYSEYSDNKYRQNRVVNTTMINCGTSIYFGVDPGPPNYPCTVILWTLNCSFTDPGPSSFPDIYPKLYVQNYLHVKTENSSGLPLSNAGVDIKDNGADIFNKPTKPDGTVKWIPVTDRTIDINGVYQNTTMVEVSYGNTGFYNNPRNVDMSTSHMEVFKEINKSIPIHKGWNLLSTPYQPVNQGVNAILSSIDGKYDLVRCYNKTDTSDHWKEWNASKPDWMNDLKA